MSDAEADCFIHAVDNLSATASEYMYRYDVAPGTSRSMDTTPYAAVQAIRQQDQT